MSWFRYGANSFSPQYRGQKYLTVCILDDGEKPCTLEEIGKGDFEKLIISTGAMDDLQFVSECLPGGPARLLIQGGVRSLSGLDRLVKLVDFECDLTNEKPFPDFGKLTKLERCWLAWDKKYDANACMKSVFILPALEDLTLRYWSKPDCTEIAQAGSLACLDLRQGALASLNGLQDCRKLRELSLSYLPKLKDIGQLPELQSLEKIHIENCPQMDDLLPLTTAENLRHIHVEKLRVRFQDLSWLAGLKKLEKISLSVSQPRIDWMALFNHPTLRDVAIECCDGSELSDVEIRKIAESAQRTVSNFERIGPKKAPSFFFNLE